MENVKGKKCLDKGKKHFNETKTVKLRKCTKGQESLGVTLIGHPVKFSIYKRIPSDKRLKIILIFFLK